MLSIHTIFLCTFSVPLYDWLRGLGTKDRGDGSMNALRGCSSLTLLTAVAVLSLSHSALADGGSSPEAPLPARLDSWADAAEEIDLRELGSLSLSSFPQGKTR